MAEVLMEFVNELRARNGTVYEARACGRQREDGLWEGWIEFEYSEYSVRKLSLVIVCDSATPSTTVSI